MELNEVTKKLPPHLMQFVIDQPYNAYTPVDQAVWRYVMRKNYAHLTKVAHESYVEGLRIAGVEIENIPTMYGMNRILQKIGWAAVAVDGFIPPGAFMEFTAYKVLVIAADIRTIDHIEYTPAPDIIHESAGHAPIIAHPEFAEYLVNIGKVGSKAFSSQKDHELYEAIRHLSIIKEDPYTPPEDIEEGEKIIEQISANMGKPSEMALLRNLHWWTVEYGLIGIPENFKLYGAGLLSSIGESEACLDPKIKKIPYSIEAAYCNYDITKHQPQLFVTPDFKHLTTVLNEYVKTMAFTTGGGEAIQKAIDSSNTGTCVLSSGIQISGTFTEMLTDSSNNPIFVRTQEPTALAFNDVEIPGLGKKTFPNGLSFPIGRFKNTSANPEGLKESDLHELGVQQGKQVNIEFESEIVVEGFLEKIHLCEGKNLYFTFKNAKVRRGDKILVLESFFVLPIGVSVISAFAGPADIEAFQPSVNVPREKTHKIKYDSRAIKLHKLYQLVRKARESKSEYHILPKIFDIVSNHFPNDWLLSMEILEIFEKNKIYKQESENIKNYLFGLKARNPQLTKLINDGIRLM